MLDRAYALLDIKALAPERRTFTGIASTPELDRQGDVFDPAGATFRNPIPLLYHHDQKLPIGRVTLAKSAAGITFEATIPAIAEPGALQTRTDDAWQSIKAGILTGVSIGFRALEGGVEYLKSGRRISRSEICELSLVAIPMNASASILTVKSLAARPTRARAQTMKLTTTEHVTALENKRAALTGRMGEIMETAAADAETLDDAAAIEHDGLAVQVKAIDADLVRWRELEKIQQAQAVAVPAVARTPALPVISVKGNNLPLGTAFTRLICAKVVCNGNLGDAAEYAKRWNDSTPEVALSLKAAIAPGTATDAAWAGPLVQKTIVNDFVELLRAATVLGKIPNFRMVPFNVQIPTQTAGGTYNWVGEAKPKPMTTLAFGTATLTWAKAAGIIAITDELAKLSTPSAEALVRNDMIQGIARFLDAQFLNPAVAAVAGVNPASVTNGAPTAAATGAPLADIIGLINHFATNNIDVNGLAFVMSPSNLLALAFRNNSDGSPQFPGLTVQGGTWKGLNFIGSTTAGTNVIAMQPSLILLADDGGVTVDVSRDASLQMDSAPMSPADATTVYVSMFQNNMIALRAERYVNWAKANANAVKYLTAAAWPAPSGTLDTAPMTGGAVANGKAKSAE